MIENEDSPPSVEWQPLPPETSPKPTAWPAALALSITFIFWGLASSLIISGVGAVIFAVAMTGWIGNICHEHRR